MKKTFGKTIIEVRWYEKIYSFGELGEKDSKAFEKICHYQYTGKKDQVKRSWK